MLGIYLCSSQNGIQYVPSRESLPLTRLGLSQEGGMTAHIQRIDQFESFLLHEGTTYNETILMESMRAADRQDGEDSADMVMEVPEDGQAARPVEKQVPPEEVEKRSATSAQTVQTETPSQEARKQRKTVTFGQEQDNVIIFASGTISPWDSEVDTHSPGTDEDLQDEEDKKKWELINLIQKQGIQWPLTGWICKQCQPTIQILMDFLQNWSLKDAHCVVDHHDYANLELWNRAVRAQQVRINLPITMIALQAVRQVECLEPLKNHLGALCQAIRSCPASGPGRIFIVNNIKNPHCVPVLGKRVQEHNRLLFRAVTTIPLQGVFYCDISQHFVWLDGQVVEPVNKYFTEKGKLSKTGMFLYRSSLLREVGVVPYTLV